MMNECSLQWFKNQTGEKVKSTTADSDRILKTRGHFEFNDFF